jgi:hypothetical protein
MFAKIKAAIRLFKTGDRRQPAPNPTSTEFKQDASGFHSTLVFEDFPAVGVVCCEAVKMLKKLKATNFVTLDLQPKNGGEAFSFTVQRANGKTPAETLNRLNYILRRLLNDTLTAELLDWAQKEYDVYLKPSAEAAR